jgi:hypothetical protein
MSSSTDIAAIAAICFELGLRGVDTGGGHTAYESDSIVDRDRGFDTFVSVTSSEGECPDSWDDILVTVYCDQHSEPIATFGCVGTVWFCDSLINAIASAFEFCRRGAL